MSNKTKVPQAPDFFRTRTADGFVEAPFIGRLGGTVRRPPALPCAIAALICAKPPLFGR